jgi:K+-sensing histidine kinase KdpD
MTAATPRHLRIARHKIGERSLWIAVMSALALGGLLVAFSAPFDATRHAATALVMLLFIIDILLRRRRLKDSRSALPPGVAAWLDAPIVFFFVCYLGWINSAFAIAAIIALFACGLLARLREKWATQKRRDLRFAKRKITKSLDQMSKSLEPLATISF